MKVFSSPVPAPEVDYANYDRDKERKREDEHRRSERLRDNISNVAVCVVWLLAALFFIATLILAWHYLMPHTWDWLR